MQNIFNIYIQKIVRKCNFLFNHKNLLFAEQLPNMLLFYNFFRKFISVSLQQTELFTTEIKP